MYKCYTQFTFDKTKNARLYRAMNYLAEREGFECLL